MEFQKSSYYFFITHHGGFVAGKNKLCNYLEAILDLFWLCNNHSIHTYICILSTSCPCYRNVLKAQSVHIEEPQKRMHYRQVMKFMRSHSSAMVNHGHISIRLQTGNTLFGNSNFMDQSPKHALQPPLGQFQGVLGTYVPH